MHRITISLCMILVLASTVLVGCSEVRTRFASPPGPTATIVLQVAPKPGDNWPSSEDGRAKVLEETKQVLIRRVGGLAGVADPSVAIEGSDKIVVKLPGVRDVKEATALLTRSGSLEFYYMKNVQTAVNPLATWRMDVSGQESRNYTFTGPKGQTLSTAKPSDLPKIMTQVVGAPQVKPVLTGADLLPNAKSSIRSTSNEPVIEIEFTSQGTEKFSDFTRSHVNEIVAVFYDGKLLTAPKINEPVTDGKAIVEGFKSLKQATEIASMLNSGALPVHLKAVSP